MITASPSLFVGIDWADRKHDICLRTHRDDKPEFCTVLQQPQALAEWVANLRNRAKEQPVLVCTEQSRGPLINFLAQYDFIQLCLPNPKSVARLREAFRPSGAKDDPHDSDVLCKIATSHAHEFRLRKPDDAQTRLMALLSERRRKVVGDQVRLVLELKSMLKGFYPLLLDLFEDLAADLALNFLAKWPSLGQLKQVKMEKVRDFFYAQNCRSEEAISKRLDQISHAMHLTQDPAIVESGIMGVADLVRRLKAIALSIEAYNEKLAALTESHPDAVIFESLPGAGPVLVPRLIAAFGTDRNRFESLSECQAAFGAVPVTVRSGKSKGVKFRRACSKFVRQTFHEYAGSSMHRCPWAHDFVEAKKRQGKTHQAAIRALAVKWIRIMYRMWKDRALYNESAYLERLKSKGSPYKEPQYVPVKLGRKKKQTPAEPAVNKI